MDHGQEMGELPIPKLLLQQAVPAAIGILVLSIYAIVDTIFIGRWVGALGIGAITIVLPITFLIASIGMSIGVGGASIIARALGAEEPEKAFLTFGNQTSLTLMLAITFVILGFFFEASILGLFGAKGDVIPYASAYFQALLPAVPFLAFAMMSNNVIRAEGEPRVAMMLLVVPAVVNLILDPIFIIALDMGIRGAGIATSISYVASASFGLWYFLFGKSVLRIYLKNMALRWEIVREIFAIGGVTLARQGSVSLLAVVMNNTLFAYGGEMGLAVYGMINRMMMFVNFPVFGITQGFLPIAGFNFGAKKWERVKETIKTAIIYGTGLASVILIVLMLFSEQVIGVFTTDTNLINQAAPAMILIFLANPLITTQLVGSAYFQAIGEALPALLLTLTKQGFCLIPLVLILPMFLGLTGIWISFPIADVLSTLITYVFLRKGLTRLGKEK